MSTFSNNIFNDYGRTANCKLFTNKTVWIFGRGVLDFRKEFFHIDQLYIIQ